MSWLADPRPGNSCSVIAEVAQNHDGSLGMAHAFIDAAADASASTDLRQVLDAIREEDDDDLADALRALERGAEARLR